MTIGSTAEPVTVGNIRIGGASHVLQVGPAETGTGERYEYFLNIIRHLVRDHGLKRRWFITYDGKHDIQGLDGDCVVFMYGEERSLTPWRYERAGLVLKAYGMRPHAVEPFRPDMPWLLDRMRVERNRLQDLAIAWRMGRVRHQVLAAKTLPIPLGYARQEDLPIEPMAGRANLVWFAGSLHNAQVSPLALYPRLANLPKLNARRQMAAALCKLQAERPDWPIALQLNQTYQASHSPAGNDYARRLMDTRICVAPRGTTPETQRFFEAMRAGCAVVCEELPDFWFYRSAPAIRLRRWSDLEQTVEGLLAVPGRLEDLQRAGLRWWAQVAGPAAMAETVAAILKGRTTVGEVMARTGPVPSKMF
ncbi:MAG TPA: hypothetical protein VHL31_06815 [Geminicoccus sp.]|jgi:hypothetical protein|uniref:hypothetical protein n=1 Tax=Geminicoccus sp. TaxID=2024832 RepID=UPI002E2F78DD|nr:hypothetical protein [Geminicoccus sp.]HEX2525998.1 hypothetical protein [Geminicoccus sp.]